jgi:hypothetical protein
MSATHRPLLWDITCDLKRTDDKCARDIIAIEAATASGARRVAASEGWSYSRTLDVDACPDCGRKR